MEIRNEIISKLLLQIEKVRRRKIVDYSMEEAIGYIDVSNNLEKILVNNNHLVFGRRGSGKTTLILAALKKSQDKIVVPIDIQPIKEEDKDNVIINILVHSLSTTKERFYNNCFSQQESIYRRQYKGIVGVYSFVSGKREKGVKELYLRGLKYIDLINKEITILQALKDKPSEITYTVTEANNNVNKESQKKNTEKNIERRFAGSGSVKLEYDNLIAKVDATTTTISSYSNIRSTEHSHEHTTETKASYTKLYNKSEILKDQIEVISFLCNELKAISGISIALYLDDFYQIPIDRQPYIIQYFHDIYKCCTSYSFCFKLSALPYRLRMNNPGNVDLSYKDDFSPIKLDNDLSELNSTKEYLLNILTNLEPSLHISKSDILSLFNNEEVLLYSIIAAGGVPRDFLLMFASLVETARGDNKNEIQKEHIYTVVKSLREDKDNNIEYDSDISPQLIHDAVKLLEVNVINNLNTNVILYPKALAESHKELLKNLVNLRYLHVVKDLTTSETRKKEEFVAYLIDMSFYAVNKRLKPGFDFRRFWEVGKDSRLTQLRQSKIWSFPDDLINSQD